MSCLFFYLIFIEECCGVASQCVVLRFYLLQCHFLCRFVIMVPAWDFRDDLIVIGTLGTT